MAPQTSRPIEQTSIRGKQDRVIGLCGGQDKTVGRVAMKIIEMRGRESDFAIERYFDESQS